MIARHKSKTLLVSEKRKFIFIHNYKVGGTSVRNLLSGYQSEVYRYLSNIVWFANPGLREKSKLCLSKHVVYKKVKEVYGDEIEAYTCFGFVRNPWDWEVSKYEYTMQNTRHFEHEKIKAMKDFSEYLQWRKDNYKTQSSFFQNENGSLREVEILKIEDSDKVNEYLSGLIGHEVQLPKKNTTSRNKYQAYYKNEADIEVIRSIYEEDIARFNYSFE
tara:strand:+ start:27 stop:677 length:651 start_codon:yes stop_codon:yes gene_type:complete